MNGRSEIDGPIPAYKGRVFVSYARNDDLKPPFEETTQGWVKFFWDQLRFELTDRGVPQANLWLDRYEIEPAEDFTQKIDEALKEARMIIPILSPNWLQRPWCLREVDRFVELQPQYVKDGIIPVKKYEPADKDLPPPLKNREGYRFYTKDPTGAVREFYWRGLRDREAYLEVIKRIAVWIAERLITSPRPAKPASAPAGLAVYLAAAADELHDARQRVANDLENAGYVVHPSGPVPDTAVKAEAMIRDGLAKAALSVHFVGDSEGAKPDGSNEGLVRLQLRLAREVPGASGPVPRVLWVPKWLPGSRDNKRDPFEVLKRFGGLMPGEEIYAEEATDLSQMLRARLMPPSPGGRVVSSLWVAAGAAEDDGSVATLANRLQSDEIRVKPRFANDTEPLDDLDRAATVILLWGMASPAAINTLLDTLVAKHARVTVLCLPGGDAVAKQHLFRDGIYVEQLAEIPPDRKSARELLVRLEIAPAGDASRAELTR